MAAAASASGLEGSYSMHRSFGRSPGRCGASASPASSARIDATPNAAPLLEFMEACMRQQGKGVYAGGWSPREYAGTWLMRNLKVDPYYFM